MKFYFLIYLVFISTLEVHSEPLVIDRVIAVVNGEAILESELKHSIAIQALSDGKNTLISVEKRNAIVEKMIDEKVLIQRARLLEISVDLETVEKVIVDIARNQGIPVYNLESKLQSVNLTLEVFKKKIEQDILLSRLRDRDLDEKLFVSDSEAKDFLITQVADNFSSGEVRIKHLKIPFDNEDKRKNAKRIASDIFSTLVNKNAQIPDNTSLIDGFKFEDWGWKKYNELPEVFLSYVKDLEKNRVSEIIESKSGYHIIKMIDRRSTIIRDTLVRYRVKHILRKVEDPSEEARVLTFLKSIRERVLSGESFELLANKYSDDTKSAQKNGDLGWAYQGDFVPSFERTALTLPKGVLSEPIRTPFGFHLLIVTDRDEQIVNEQQKLRIAKNFLRDKKTRDVVQEWILDLRSNSYIEKKEFDIDS